MSFIIHKVVVHFIDKQPEMATSDVSLATSNLPITDNTIDLVSRLDSNFEKKTDVLLGAFDADSISIIPDCFWGIENERKTPDAFIEYTQSIANVLNESLYGVIGARGGHLVMCDYTVDGSRMIGIYLLRKLEMYDLSKGEGSYFELAADEVLDVDKAAFAVRMLPGGDRPVQVVKPKKPAGEFNYFLDAMGLLPYSVSTATELTYEFMEAVDEIPMPMDKDTGFALNQGEFSKELIKFAAKSPQQTIRVKEFDEYFYGNGTPLQDLLEEGNSDIGDSFRVDKKILREKHFFSAGVPNLRVTCTADHIRNGLVHIDEAKGTITIHSDDIASMLLSKSSD